MDKFSHIDLFSGIGGFHLSINKYKGECIGFSEIDKFAIDSYCSNFDIDKSLNLGDITKLDTLPYCDILTAGVPCQSWSIAGKNLGFNDSRGKLWDNVIDLLGKSKPKVFIFENVKGLYDPRNKESLSYIINNIRNVGYYVDYYLINSNEYGSIQNRVRLYIIGFKCKSHYDLFKLDNPYINKLNISNYLDLSDINSNFDQNDVECFMFNDLRNGKDTIHSWDIIDTTSRQKHICLILLQNRRKSKYGKSDGNPLSYSDFIDIDSSINQNEIDELVDIGIFKIKNVDGNQIKYDFKNSKISSGIFGINRLFLPNCKHYPTLVASDTNDFICDYISFNEYIYINNESLKDYVINNIIKYKKYRQITKNEACLIQGFPKDFKLPYNRNRWMKLIGNSVSINVIDMLIKNIIKTNVFK